MNKQKSKNILDLLEMDDEIDNKNDQKNMKNKKVGDLRKILKDHNIMSTSKYNKNMLMDLIGKVDKFKEEGKDYDYHFYEINGKKISLNEDQYKIVTADKNEHMRIIACAGSGKTTTIICRIKYLIDHGVEPSSIILTTFNVDAAESMKRKLEDIFGFMPKIMIGTIDSISCRWYHMYFKKETFVGISEYSTLLLDFLRGENGEKITKRYNYFFFDEFQDSNDTQFDILKEFYKNGSKITVIGDDAQNIYSFRNSNVGFILNYDKYIKDVVTYKLVNNYRSTPEIINFANKSIELNTDQIPKEMKATKKSEKKKPIIIKYSNETNQSISIINKILEYNRKHKIPYDEICVISRINFPLKNIEEEIEKHNNEVDYDDKIPYIALITDDNKDNKAKIKKDHLSLVSVHKAKGLEWDVVFLITCNDDKFPSEVDMVALQEERRLFYVAVTRPKRHLEISFTGNTISRFVGEIKKHDVMDFIKFDESYVRYNDTRNVKFKSGVTQLIEMLDQRDIEDMRKKSIIPDLIPTIENVHNKHKYDPYIDKYFLYSDYGIYIDRYISRAFGILDIKTGGLEDDVANIVINSLVLNPVEFNMYTKYNINISVKLKNELFGKYPAKILADHIDKKFNDGDYIKKISESDKYLLAVVLEKVIKTCKSLNITTSQLFVVPKSYLPNEFIDEMKKNYANFSSKTANEKILYDIYKISLCQNICENRRRLLYRDVSEYFNTDKKLYTDIDKWVGTFKNHDVKIKIAVRDQVNIITGEIDMFDDTTATITDFKASVNSECKLEWIIQLLTYTALLRLQKGKSVLFVQIYNPLTGTTAIFDISEWKKEAELLEYLNNVRNKRLSRTKSI